MAEELPRDQLPTIPREHAADPSTLDQTGAYHPEPETLPRLPDAPADAPAVAGYAITSMIAKGGMGRVWLGRDLTLDRDVAIKTLLPGADAARFVTESKITAKLPHPGIPPVHAMGMLSDSSPYLVIKFVQGRTLAAMLEARTPPNDDLPRFVQIFEQIAQAVGFAHSQGVIHRDLKPLNVMVGAFGEVQVMDWGLAKDMASRERERPEGLNSEIGEFTQAGTVMGTPGYMAPEQARGEAVDARADVFALGAMLAAILTGKPAFLGTTVRETIQKAAQANLADVLARLDASPADVELTALAKRCLAADAANRPSDGRAVAEAVATYRAGVENRLHAAKEAEAASRAREVEQHKRRRVTQWAAGIVTVVLLAGIAGTAIGLVKAKKESGEKELARQSEAARAEGERRAKEDAELKRLAAERNLAYSQQSNKILGMVFEGLDPKTKYHTLSELRSALRDNLSNATGELDQSAIGDPLAIAAVRNTLGHSLLALGETGLATVQLEKAFTSYTSEIGTRNAKTLAASEGLARAYHAAGRLPEAIALFEMLRDQRIALAGEEHHATLTTLHNLALTYMDAGRPTEAVAILERNYGIWTRTLGENAPATLSGMHALASIYQETGLPRRAIPLLERVRDARIAALGNEHPKTLSTLSTLALAYENAGALDDAIALFEKVRDAEIKTLGADHPSTLTTLNNLATAHLHAKKLPRAVELFEQLRDPFIKHFGSTHPTTLAMLGNLGAAYDNLGKGSQAVEVLEHVRDAQIERLGTDHPDTLTTRHNLGGAYIRAGDLAKATEIYREVWQTRIKVLGADHPNTMMTLYNLGLARRDAKSFAEATELLLLVMSQREKKLGKDHPDTITATFHLGLTYFEDGKPGAALPHFESAASSIEAGNFAHPISKPIILMIVGTLDGAGNFDRADRWRRTWIAHIREQSGPESTAYGTELSTLGLSLVRRANWREAEPVLREILKRREKLQPAAWNTAYYQSLLGAALMNLGRYDESEPLLLKGFEGLKARENTIQRGAKTILREAADRLISYYLTTDNSTEAKKWQAERAKYPNEVAPKPQPVM